LDVGFANVFGVGLGNVNGGGVDGVDGRMGKEAM